MKISQFHFSQRGWALTWARPPMGDRKVLTVELYEKWYALQLLDENGGVSEVEFPEFRDHCPDPVAVQLLAVREGYYMDPLALEMIIGRWELETVGDSEYSLPERAY